MASATIVFDNADGWLPIDYTEVAITRRAYRDGDNEYLLNGQRVRLKDVSELLAQSGLAERTYTIIGQGLVDTALSLKAEERRRLFEEAAGIGLHRSRREETLKRLEATARNLERVEDILVELTPRLRSLERQARRSQEYEQVKADLRLVLREWYGYHWHRAQQDLAEARELARSRETVLERARREQIDLAQKLTGSTEAIQALRNRLGEWHRQSSQLHARRETQARELAVSEERARSLAETCQNLESELSRLEEEKSLFQERLAGAVEELSQLQAERAEAAAQAASTRQSLQSQQAECARVEKTIQAARQELSALTAEQAHLQARQTNGQSSLERQKEQLEKGAEALSQEERALSTAQSALQEAARRFDEARRAVGSAAGRLSGLRQALGEVENRRKEALEQRAARDAQEARLHAQVSVLEGAEKNLAGYSQGARLLIGAARAGRLEGVRGLLGSVLEIPAEYETAIAAALGEWADAVLLNAGPQQVLAYLSGLAGSKEPENARAALLPLPDLRPGDIPLEPPPVEGLVGPAAALLNAPADLREALALLLGPAWVVRDREAALKVLAALREGALQESREAARLRVVTLQGEVFYATGPVMAGPVQAAPGSAAGERSSPLSRPRQLRELRDQVDELARQKAGLDGQLQALDEDRGRLRNEEGRLAQEGKTAQASEDRLRASHREADLAVEKARRQLQWRREERQRMEAEVRRGEADLASASARLVDLDGQIAQARQKLRGLNEQLSQALALDETQTRLAHWETRLAVAERALDDARKRHAERQATLEQVKGTLAGQATRLAGVRAAQGKLEEEKGRLRQEAGLLAGQIAALRSQIDPAEAELESLESEQSEQAAREAAARQTLSLSEHHHAQARILLARHQEALDALRRRIEDDFGLVAFDFAQDQAGQVPLPLDGMVEQLPIIRELPAEIEETLKRQRAQLRRMGPINPEAQVEYEGVRQRFDFLTTQVTDLNQAQADLRKVIAELDRLMEREFRKTFEAVAREFHEIFTRLFGGGTARLVLTGGAETPPAGGEPVQPGYLDAGIEIEARLPGRRTQGLALLSGGERSLTATALVFALLKVSPTPFCVLDEVDAMLDEANVGRFRDLLSELSGRGNNGVQGENGMPAQKSMRTQFIVVTHNRNTVQVADVIYGVTMGRDSASQVISLKMDEVESGYVAD
jgi:chromosome segregation protein